MSSQTVFRLTSQEGIDKIQAFKEPIPSAGRNEVLVKIRSVSLNYRDIAIANNTYPLKVKDGVVLGSDMAGEIVQIGSQVSGFSVGDHVTTPVTPGYLYGTVSSEDHFTSFGGGQDGMLQEHIILPVQALVKLPKSTLSFTQWAATNSTGVTVWNAFYGCNPLKPGDTVLVLGKAK
jgi:NADPH:quinone reductase-like Zn-dependent oxidoreductase